MLLLPMEVLHETINIQVYWWSSNKNVDTQQLATYTHIYSDMHGQYKIYS